MKGVISRNICHKWLSKAALLGTLLLMALNTSANNEVLDRAHTPVRVSLENNGTQLIVITPTEQWQMTLERFSLLGNQALIQRALHDIPYFYRARIQGQVNSWVRINSDSVTDHNNA